MAGGAVGPNPKASDRNVLEGVRREIADSVDTVAHLLDVTLSGSSRQDAVGDPGLDSLS